jgi:hypothetical protein
MSALDLEPIPPAGQEPPARRSGKSTLDRIRSMYAKAKTDQPHLDLPVPRTPLLRVRYRAIDPDEWSTTATRTLDVQLDTLIEACECILVREGKEFEPLLDAAGEPVRFDEMFSEMADLGVPPVEQGGTARQVVLAAFRRAPVPAMAVSSHFEQVIDWMSGAGGVDEEELLGES